VTAASRPATHRRAAARLGGLLGILLTSATLPAQAVALPTVAVAAIERTLHDLDAHLQRGDVAGFLAAWAPDHAGNHALLQQRLQRLLAGSPTLARTTTITIPPRAIGPRTVVRVRHELQLGPADRRQHLVEDALVAFRGGDGGAAVPTFTVEIPTEAACVRNDRFRCPPCNYEIGGIAGWLCVPVRPDRAQALEAATFWLLGTDVACDVSVRIDEQAPAAVPVAERLGAALHELDPRSAPGSAAAWLPTAHAPNPPAALTGARLAVATPDARVVVHVLTFGALQHLLLLRGSERALATHAAAVQALLDSYRLLQTDVDRALAAASSLEHHQGGSLHAGKFAHERYGVQMQGPAGWTAQQRAGGAAFRVVWSNHRQSRLWLFGHVPPPGLAAWSEATAERWLTHLLASSGLRVVPATDSGWALLPACDAKSRSVTAVPATGDGTTRPRLLRLVVSADLLVLADGAPADDADAELLRQAQASLVRQ
jgi:hypothetical protein